MEKELEKNLNNIIQSKVIYSRAGGGAGSIISMEFICKNNDIYTLWVECDWRIENKREKRIIATSMDSIEAITGRIAQSVLSLEGEIIESIELSSFYDLCVNFHNGICLNVFCILSYDYEYETNWYLANPKQNLVYEITNHFEVRKGKYE